MRCLTMNEEYYEILVIDLITDEEYYEILTKEV